MSNSEENLNTTFLNKNSPLRVKKVVVLTTAMLTFIPFWKAAAVVLCDFGSSAFYVGGIAMRAFGQAFPWYVIAVMLFAGAMLAVYTESCSMFVRGGVYKVVKEGLGGTVAKVATGAIMFDFVLTGPISGVSAGHYLSGLINSLFHHFGVTMYIPENTFAVCFAILVTMFFWYQNVKGIEDSSDKSAKIIIFAFFICVILFVWSIVTIAKRGAVLPTFALDFSDHAYGWVKPTLLQKIGMLGVVMAIGHSVLALSGLETMAQVFREIEYPKIKNLKKAAIIVFIFALVFTGGLTFLSSLIIPPEIIGQYSENLLSGLSMQLWGPQGLKLILQALVVFAGVIMLSGAVNTALIGSNGVLNRVAEDGVLTDWFRNIHPKYGTTHNIINVVAITQILIIVLSGGKVYLLGEAYAFGVLWSFVLETAAIVMLRFKNREKKREFMVPFNIKIKNYYFPVGITIILLILVALAGVNLFTKKTATITGISFTVFLFIVFWISEKLNAKKANAMFEEGHREKINTKNVNSLEEVLGKLNKPNTTLVAVKNPSNLYHFEEVLKTLDENTTDVVIFYAKPVTESRFGRNVSFAPTEENELFTKVILSAEKFGHRVMPILVQSNDAFYAISQVAKASGANQIVMGVSGSHGANNQLERLVMAWGALKKEELEKKINVRILWEGREVSHTLE
ncbi:MAG: amino acid permease [Elusimicrobiaceae bacterium]|jgi:amino acid transporter|nr:amino acid permease [Elusimicrobiaceae bacterium]MBT5988035.1 amino acid permease [Elusimicrobiaceae bacterium]